jgi:3-hydroxyisobutyrate dehydrogenase-like beta-hydroxyacid dehydrogenase
LWVQKRQLPGATSGSRIQRSSGTQGPSICTAESRRNGANLPMTALVDQFYSEVEKMGGKRWDTSSLLARLER